MSLKNLPIPYYHLSVLVHTQNEGEAMHMLSLKKKQILVRKYKNSIGQAKKTDKPHETYEKSKFNIKWVKISTLMMLDQIKMDQIKMLRLERKSKFNSLQNIKF